MAVIGSGVSRDAYAPGVTGGEYRVVPMPGTTGWAYIENRRDVPGVVALARRTGRPMSVGVEAAQDVLSWIADVGWRGWAADKAPVRVIRRH
jgi:hypothetical protein